MKYILLVLIAAGIIFYFKGPSLFLAQAATATNSANSSQQTTISSGSVLGIFISMAKNTFNQFVPQGTFEKFASETASNVVNTVQSNVQSAAASVTNNLVANQLINNFKNLPKPVQEQVKQNICK